jgi:hypothetical protein
LLVAFVADELPDALVLLAALPLDDDVLPPLEPLLVNVELPVVAEDPPVADVAEFAVEPWLDVLLLAVTSVDESLDTSDDDLTWFAVSAELSVVAFVDASILLALLAEDDISVVAAVLLALFILAVLVVALEVSNELLVTTLVAEFDDTSLAVWFDEVLAESTFVLVFSTSDVVVLSN